MRAETLEGGDMINGPPTALEEPPVPSPIHPHHPATHPSSNCILHQVWSPKKKNTSPNTRAFKVAENYYFRQILLFLWIPGCASRDIPHSPQPRWLNYDPPIPYTHPSFSLTQCKQQQDSSPRTHPPGILGRGIHYLWVGQVKEKKCETVENLRNAYRKTAPNVGFWVTSTLTNKIPSSFKSSLLHLNWEWTCFKKLYFLLLQFFT